jgi:hypothetical protein
MATGQKWFNTVRLRDAFGAYGLAMPSSLVKQHRIIGWASNLNGPVCIFAQGRSVPISRGSPPISGG